MLIDRGFSLFKSFEDVTKLKEEAKKFKFKYFLSNKMIKKI